MRILVTGACGICGTALKDLPFDKVFMDARPAVPELYGERFVQGDITDSDLLCEVMAGCDVIVHAAASSRTWHHWKEVLHHNVEGVRNVLAAAACCGVRQMILLSSNHVVGMYEIENAPRIYEPGHGIMVDHRAAVRPDSYYGISKAIGEDVARVTAENGGPRCVALRLGSVRPAEADHPYAYAEDGVARGEWTRGSDAYRLQERRLKALWQSRRDFVQLVERAVMYEGSRFDIFYGLSDNARRWLDIDRAREVLGYAPADAAEAWSGPPDTQPWVDRGGGLPAVDESICTLPAGVTV